MLQLQQEKPIQQSQKVSFATIGKKYQIVIPKEIRKTIRGLKPGSKLDIKALKDGSITLRVYKSNWSDENYGSFKKYWQGVDPIAEIEKMRNEW